MENWMMMMSKAELLLLVIVLESREMKAGLQSPPAFCYHSCTKCLIHQHLQLPCSSSLVWPLEPDVPLLQSFKNNVADMNKIRSDRSFCRCCDWLYSIGWFPMAWEAHWLTARSVFSYMILSAAVLWYHASAFSRKQQQRPVETSP